MKTGLTLASKLESSTSCAIVWIKWSWLGIWGKGVRPDTDYDFAKQLNSETVKKRKMSFINTLDILMKSCRF